MKTDNPSAPALAAATPTVPAAPTLKLTAELLGQDVAAVEAAVVSVGDAYAGGDMRAIRQALAAQALLLQALGVKLLRVAGADLARLQRVQVYSNLALRAFDQARKALAALSDMSAQPKQQTNVQVNISRDANELMDPASG